MRPVLYLLLWLQFDETIQNGEHAREFGRLNDGRLYVMVCNANRMRSHLREAQVFLYLLQQKRPLTCQRPSRRTDGFRYFVGGGYLPNQLSARCNTSRWLVGLTKPWPSPG